MNDKNHGLKTAGPCTMVIFGASGDLTQRKLLPALYNLAKAGRLPKDFAVVGVARAALTADDVLVCLKKGAAEISKEGADPKILEWLKERISFVTGEFNDLKTFGILKDKLKEMDERFGTRGNALFYLATPPAFFSLIVQQLGQAGLAKESPGMWRRVIIEKPFGSDLESAMKLNGEIRTVLSEKQVYRIDHYLGKETVQNLMVFRFGNGIFEPIWNRRYIDHVQITVSEAVGVEKRAGYYEGAGALRDMVENHLFQLLSLIAMEPPISFEADAVRDEKTKVLRALQVMEPEEVLQRTVRGQYGEGSEGGQKVKGYREEPGVDAHSSTETFVALKLFIDNWRWASVPFYLRTGKRLQKRMTEITIQFRSPPHLLFKHTAASQVPPNQLVIQIQPKEGITLSFQAKVPGPEVQTGEVNMNFNYSEHFGSEPSTGYETLLYDCICGDATLFQRADSVEVGWQVVMPILDVWKALPARHFPNYPAGSWGPEEADKLLTDDGRSWRNHG